jgi:hypothetical protein
MTEEEAKNRWCPFARVAGNNYANESYNRVSRSKKVVAPNSHCIGSACMAWRWFQSTKEQGTLPPPYEGFCGLAGNP